MDKKIDFELRGVANKIEEKLLAVPIYQRSYAWSEEQIKEYWSDLRGAFSDDAPEYFIGTIVITKQGLPPRDTIIDGQQRLATTSILIAAIRDEYKMRDEQKRADIIQNKYLSTSDLETTTEIAKLQLNSEDCRFFEKYIVNGDSTIKAEKPSHVLIVEAYNYFRQQIAKVADDSGPDWIKRLIQWIEFLKEKLKAVFVEVPTESDAFLIFETLNDRGADLTIADLLKNYLFRHAGSKLDAVRDGWMQVLGALEITSENSLFTTFLRHYWSSKFGIVRERELYKSIKERISTEAQVIDFIGELQHASALYAALLNSDHEYWDKLGGTAKQNIETLLRLDLEQNRPLLLAVMQHFQESEIKKTLRVIVSWSVRGLIVGGLGGGMIEKTYCTAAAKIRKGEIKSKEELFREVSKTVATDEQFTTIFKTAAVSKNNIARYYLIALENREKNISEPELVPNTNEEVVNLEHILPKRANDKDWGGIFNSEERKDWVYRMGNLALLQKGPNGRIGNKPFADKKQVLLASSFILTKEAGEQQDWNKEAINGRQEKLAKLAASVWPRN
jgi:uncharacterized protein with ParB-like and HNH nuclease domain